MNFTDMLHDKIMDVGWNGAFAATPVMEVYGGTIPASPELAVPDGLDHYFTITLASPPWGNASSGVKAKTGSWIGTFTVGGAPAWFRIRNSSEAAGEDYTVARIDGTFGNTPSDDILLPKVNWDADDLLEIESFSLVGGATAVMGLPARGNFN